MNTVFSSLKLVVDPRFAGGTSAAVAREIYAIQSNFRVSVAAIESKMFKGQCMHPLIREACEDTGTPVSWNPSHISSDVVVLHNPSFLKFDRSFATRIFCRLLIVVCHENFLRPSGAEGFDVAHCLSLISDAAVAQRRILAPVSGWNRTCATLWMETNQTAWALADEDWTNICDFELKAPSRAPSDRRGRHSRTGMEKFPSIGELEIMFPETAKSVRILGADNLLGEECPVHWDLMKFGTENVSDFLQTIDFMVYFTNSTWRESFGRVIAEALAAGKVVITDPETSKSFGDGVVSAKPREVSDIVTKMVASPKLYREQVEAGHRSITKFSRDAFVGRAERIVSCGLNAAPLHGKEALYALL